MSLGDSLGSLTTGMSVSDAIESYLARLNEPKAPDAAESAARAQSEAIAELMFLLAAVDGEVAEIELGQLRKSLRELSEVGVLAAIDADVLVPAFATRLSDEGWSSRMHAAAATITTPDVQRLAYRLAAGVAFVDDRVEAAESAALDSLAKTFEIEGEESHQILVEVQERLFS